jgi:2-polyprenyl-3-methyl-5-hydroxy-6-metoxy-1,4-benzoquinol methylase
MIKQGIRTLFHHLGYEIHKISISPYETRNRLEVTADPPPRDPVWPLPRRPDGLSDEEIRKEFAKHRFWHYAYAFEGGISFPVRHAKPDAFINAPERHVQRFRHFMPYLIQSQNGSLKGKRILDIACNSGFWSIQCALLGAEVVGFDARPELIEQAETIKSIVGVNNVTYKVLDFHDMSPQSLGGTFDIVLNLGVLYHLSDPLEALQRTKAMARNDILLDTAVYRSDNPVIQLRWEEPLDIWAAYLAGIVAFPSKSGINLMLRHSGVAEWFEIPIRTGAIPRDYLEQRRASWLIKV